MNGPAPDGRTRSTWGTVVAVALLVLSVGMIAATATTAAPPGGHQHAPAAVVPGEDPRVYQWFKSRESAVIELNNALQAARDLTTTSSRSHAACVRLSLAVWRFQFNDRSPEPKLDAPASAGQTQFAGAARACSAGDFTAMRRLIEEGAVLRADAQHHVDEILEGEE